LLCFEEDGQLPDRSFLYQMSTKLGLEISRLRSGSQRHDDDSGIPPWSFVGLRCRLGLGTESLVRTGLVALLHAQSSISAREIHKP
jgi:hypothetical protein